MLGIYFWLVTIAATVFLVPWVAGEKGRSPVAWFFIAVALSPFLALLALAAVPTEMEDGSVR